MPPRRKHWASRIVASDLRDEQLAKVKEADMSTTYISW